MLRQQWVPQTVAAIRGCYKLHRCPGRYPPLPRGLALWTAWQNRKVWRGVDAERLLDEMGKSA